MNTNIIISISKYVEKIINHVEGYTLDRAHRIFDTHISEVDQEYKRQSMANNLLNEFNFDLEHGKFAKAIVSLACINALNKSKLREVEIALKQDLAEPQKVVQPITVQPTAAQLKAAHAANEVIINVLELYEFRQRVDIHQTKALINNLQLSISRVGYELNLLGQQLSNPFLNKTDLINIQLKMQQNYKMAMGIADILSKGVK